MNKFVFLFLFIIVGNNSTLNAQTVSSTESISLGVFVGSEDTFTPAPAAGISSISGGKMIFKLHTSCYSTNLRSVANPISPDSVIKANFKFKISNQDLDFQLSFPGDLTTQPGMVATTINAVQRYEDISYSFPDPVTGLPTAAVMTVSNFTLPGNSMVGLSGNKVISYVDLTTKLARNADGTPAAVVDPPSLVSYSFSQTITDCSKKAAVYGMYGYSMYNPSYACGAYMAKNGSATAVVSNFIVSKDNSTVELSVSFPGQTGFCGGWWSPLMVFFDEERPTFTNISDFPLNPGGRTSWVEAKSKGYFLVYDEKLNGKIISKEQLFGDSEKHKNGFEKLAQYDSNKDGWINAKDKKFKYLFLWNDKNGNGISEKTELFPAKDKLVKISLNYDPGSIRPIGKFAEEREKAKFYFKKAGKIVAGDIVDVWLSPQSQTSLAVIGQ